MTAAAAALVKRVSADVTRAYLVIEKEKVSIPYAQSQRRSVRSALCVHLVSKESVYDNLSD
jgi:hypothetical protein|tara:strand:- start:269 stop:451 length:183 start_codon:yes stop_codon:yes gene_type:complete